MASNVDRKYYATWLYNLFTLDNGPLLDELARLRVNRVFMSVDQAALSQGKNKLIDFIGAAHVRDIEVHAMTLEDPHFAETGQHAQACAIVTAFLDFVEANPGSTFDGIHIDTEPHLLFKGGHHPAAADNAHNEDVMAQYLQLIKELAQLIAGAGLRPNARGIPFQFSAAIAWWYNRQAQAGVLPSASLDAHAEKKA